MLTTVLTRRALIIPFSFVHVNFCYKLYADYVASPQSIQLTYKHTYIHIYIHTNMHACMHTYMNAYMVYLEMQVSSGSLYSCGPT